MSQYKHIWLIPIHTNYRVLLTLLLSQLTNYVILFALISAKILTTYMIYIMQNQIDISILLASFYYQLFT